MPALALLLASPCAALPPQERPLPAAVQRELRIHVAEPALLAQAAERAAAPAQDSTRAVGLAFLGASLRGFAAAEAESAPSVAELAARFCEPALNPQEERIQAEEPGFLVAYLQPAQHAWLERFLELQRAPARDWLADLSARVYTLPEGATARLALDGTATLLADADAIARMEAALATRGGEILVAPRLRLLPRQRGEMSHLEEVAYIKTFELRVIEPGGVEIADPIVEVVREGLTLGVRALQVGDRLYGLEIESVLSEIERPIPTRKMRLSPLHPTEVEIGLPQVRSAKVSATVRLADGGGVLLIGGGLLGGREMAVVLSFRRAAPAAAPEPAD